MAIYTSGPWFTDEHQRKLLLRGVNLGGSSKIPTRPNGATHRIEGFFEHRDISFVGRPFPLAEADEHFKRLRAWGFSLLRFLVTWEAVEHAGPGIYDQEYLDYLRKVIEKAGEHGFSVIIDPHQDVWSRFSGGDGAPGWTLEAAGFELSQVHETGAAILHQMHGDPFPQMIWPTNGARLAAATMFTLFFGGNDFAPATRAGDEPIQEFLQRHYLAAFQEVARCLQGLPQIIGYEVMNEPMVGFIGCQDLTRPILPFKYGALVTPLQSMLLGAGIPQQIEIWQRQLFRSRLVERRWFNPNRLRIWREGYDGVWSQNGIWDLDEKGRVRLLRPQHFSNVNGLPVDFNRDYLRPFVNRYAAAIRQVDPDALIFLETDPQISPPQWGPQDAANIVYAPHWYDPMVLFLKTFNPWLGFDVHTHQVVLGKTQVRQSFARQLLRHKEYSTKRLGDVPSLLGEIGIAFDLNRGQAYISGDFQAQIKALDRSLRAADDALIGYTLWNYTADNDNERGDQWNGEDLSIFSRSQQTNPEDIHSGGRAVAAFARPYPLATAGTPLKLSFDIERRLFLYTFRHEAGITQPTEIFVPDYQYPNGYHVWISDGDCEMHTEQQILIYRHSSKQAEHHINISPRIAL